MAGVWVVAALVVVGGVVVLRPISSAETAHTFTSPSQSNPPTPTSTPSTTSAPSTTSTPGTTPSASPSARSTAQILATQNRVLLQNPLYRAGPLPASRCKEPSVRPSSVANVRAYYTQFLQCLNKVWAPVIRRAGFRFSPPQLEVFTGRTRTTCAVTNSAAYCAGVISMNADFDVTNHRTSDRLWTRTTMAFLIAHEYGHHIQKLTGITAASDIRDDYLNGVDAPLTESRRIELQASCLSGVYLGANRRYFPATGAWLRRWQWTVRNRGDEWNPTRTHGNKTNHGRWSRRGFDAGDPAACNTFAASTASVG